ncbi:hypothetical protein G9P44_006253 [Scheffersomyces stipitis]|nr:hypothetical protein G9P44_006253 [Scheffersomyces stipitis]
MSFLKKKSSSSSSTSRRSSNASSTTSASNYTTSKSTTSFCKFDEKKDYVRRCSLKKTDAKGHKHPVAVTFCLGK